MSAGLQARESAVSVQLGGGEGEQLSDSWIRIRGRLRAEVGDAAFRSWLKPMELVGMRNETLRMSVPSRFMRDWINSNYADRLRVLWSEERSEIQGLEVVVQPPARPSSRQVELSPQEPRGEEGGSTIADFSKTAPSIVGRDEHAPSFEDEKPSAAAPSRRPWIPASPSKTLSSASLTNSPMPRHDGWVRRTTHPSTPCSSIAALAWAKPT